VLATAAVLLLALTVLVSLHWGALQDADDSVTRAARDAVGDSAATLSIARALTHLGDPLVVTLATVALAVAMLAVRAYRTAAYVAVVRLAVVVATAGLKAAVGRDRPEQLHPVAVAHGYSFPSGHASGSAALWCSVAVLLAARVPRFVAVAVALVVPLIVAATRVLLGVHFLTDVIAGLLLGAGLAVALAAKW
jgi:undecaprenyl-diphosphatase